MRRGACSSSNLKSSADFIMAIFAISPRLLEMSRPPCDLKKSQSSNAATGGTYVPKRFLEPQKLQPFLAPTEASTYEREVVGTRMYGVLRRNIDAARPTTSRQTPPNRDDRLMATVDFEILHPFADFEG